MSELPTEETSAEDLSRLHQLQIRNTLRGLLFIATIAAMYFARDFLLPVVLAIFLALTLRPAIRYLDRHGVPAALTAVVFVIVILLSCFAAVYFLSGPIMSWFDQASQLSRTFSEKFNGLRAPIDTISDISQKLATATDSSNGNPTQEVVIHTATLPALFALITGYPMQILITLAATLVIAVFMMASGNLFYEKLVRILPHLTARKRALRIVYDIENAVSTYVLTISALNAGFGILICVDYYFLGMPVPYLWGFLAFAFNFFPYVGAVSAVVLSSFMAIVTFDQLGYALLVPLSYIVLSLSDSEIIRPQILGRSLQMNAVAILLSLAFFTWLWGIAGAAIAIPLLISLKVFCDHFEELSGLGEFIAAREVEKEPVVTPEASIS
ncbi:MAG: AI-2E family transporter [Pseudomonadota bacterium]|nr:AI-2E family transporter [Pseudomonadota bacterium]